MFSLPGKQIEIDFLYVDMETCARCKGTDANLTIALQMARSLLDAADSQVIVRKTLVDSEEKAAELGFQSSPTIRVNGRDVAVDLRESRCEDRTGICGGGEDISCRVWRYKDEDYEVAPVPVLLNAIMSAVYSWDPGRPRQELAGDRRRLFANRRETAAACCGPEKASSCCVPQEKSACCGAGVPMSPPATCGCQ